MTIGYYTAVGFALDAFDWLVIGMIPGVGDIADVIATVYWTRKLGALGLLGAVELVPAADVLPVNTALGMAVDRQLAQARVAT